MNEEGELGGNFWKNTLVLLILIFANCSGDPDLEEYNAQEIINTCDDDFLAVAFNLADREYLFTNPDILLGQPINYFPEVLTDNEQVSTKERFIADFEEMSGENQKQTSKQFLRWCESNKLINELNQDLSSEEVFFLLSQISILSPFFNEILPERSRSSNEIFTLEDFATLSSAEFNDIHQQLLTAISNLPPQEYEAIQQDIERAISKVNES